MTYKQSVYNNDPCPLCHTPGALDKNKSLQSTKNVLFYLDPFRGKKQEYFVCLSIDSSMKLIARRIISLGSLTSTIVHPREVFADPLADRAFAIILAHNHPSGDPTPSKADIEITQQLIAAGLILGIQLHDHLIITSKTHYSFRHHRLL